MLGYYGGDRPWEHREDAGLWLLRSKMALGHCGVGCASVLKPTGAKTTEARGHALEKGPLRSKPRLSLATPTWYGQQSPNHSPAVGTLGITEIELGGQTTLSV
jgi:hypothetical protein